VPGPQIELDPVKAGEAGIGRPFRVAGREAVNLASKSTERTVGTIVLADLKPCQVRGEPCGLGTYRVPTRSGGQ
jgi:hypothetical protein